MKHLLIIKHKIRETKGFSLSELLVVVVIVTLLSIMIATGTDTAVRAYGRMTDETNAEVLLSTCVTMLRNELTTATEISVADDKKSVSFKNVGTGYISVIRSGACSEEGSTDTAEKIWITEYGTAEKQLISDITATNDLMVSFDSIEYSDGAVTVKELTVKKTGKNRALAVLPELIIGNL